MDNLAHTLAGAALGEAGLKRLSPLAMPTLLIGANLPDLDVIAILFGEGLSFRRGWTHGVLALFVLPLLLTMGVLAWDALVRRGRGRPAAEAVRPVQILLVSCVAVLSHPLLDWMNSYGMRWLMPFDGRWFYGDALFIVDPWIWAALGIGVVLSRRRQEVRPAVIAAGAVAVYGAVMLGLSAYGRAQVLNRLPEFGIYPERLMVASVAIDPSRRQVVIQDRDRYLTGTLRWLPRPILEIDETVIAANRDHPLARLAAADPEARRFLTWSRFPFFVIAESESGFRVRIDDARYSNGVRPSWAAVQVEIPTGGPPRAPPAGRIVSSGFSSVDF